VKVLLIIFTVVAALIALVWVFQRKLIYLPDRSIPDGPLTGYESATLTTEDGLELDAWYLEPRSDDKLGTVVVFNGNAGNRADRVPLAEALVGRGYAVLLMDYRGYGGNPGSPSETGLTRDARAAISYLSARPGVDPANLVYFGESLGAAVAVDLATEIPPAALVLRSPFTSLADVAAVHYPLLPAGWLLKDRFENEADIGHVDAPILIIVGSSDVIVPPEQSRALFDTASEPSSLVEIEGAGHNDFSLLAGDEMIFEIASFLDGVLPRVDRN